MAALVEADGQQDRAAELLGCNPQTIRNYRRRHPEINKYYRLGKTDLLRRIALTHYELALGEPGWQDDPEKRQPDRRAGEFILKAQGGWTERTNLPVEWTVIRETVLALERSGHDANTEFAALIQKANNAQEGDIDGVARQEVIRQYERMVARRKTAEASAPGDRIIGLEGQNGRNPAST